MTGLKIHETNPPGIVALERADVSSSTTLDDFVTRELEEHGRVFESTRHALVSHFGTVLKILEDSIRLGGKVLLFGNGGSAADAQHIAAELVIRYKQDRPPIAAVALTTDSSALTACGNDLGFDALFSRQVEALARKDDVAIGISTSGRSANVLSALREARRKGARTVGLTGGEGGDMAAVCDAIIVVPSHVTARIQEMHIMIGHMLCKGLEQRLGLV
jgi:D-sedoheptulose 7-phosphate isomerase